MDLRQLRYFSAVAEELHFGRAASRLHISQPPLSVAIRELERELKAQLLVRNTRNVRLTPAGRILMVRANELLATVDATVDEIREAGDGVRGSMQIGFVSSASYSVLPQTVREFSHDYAGVDLVLTPLTSGEQVERLAIGELDLGLLRDPAPLPGLHTELVLSEPYAAVIPRNHPLAQTEVVEPNDLNRQPLVFFPAASMPGYVSRLTGILNGEGVDPWVVQNVVHQETAFGLVSAGVGISILPESTALPGFPETVVRPFCPGAVTQLHAAWHGERNRAAENFTAGLIQAATRSASTPDSITPPQRRLSSHPAAITH